jgi:opacity protein-like surface antigen
MSLVLAGSAALVLTLASAGTARAQQFISPMAGYNFGGDASCPNISGCTDKRLNIGVALGTMGSVLGFEEEFNYANNFFGNASNMSSSVLTLMSNAIVGPAVGPIRPYGVGGIGLMKTHVEFSPSSLLTTDHNNLGWDIGGGVILNLTPHLGLKGDIRHFHSFQDTSVAGFTLGNTKLDYGRAGAGLVLKF